MLSVHLQVCLSMRDLLLPPCIKGLNVLGICYDVEKGKILLVVRLRFKQMTNYQFRH